MRRTLAVITTAPIPGQASKLLCPPLDLSTAARLHEQFIIDTVAKASSVPDTDLVVAYSPDGTLPFFRAIAPNAAGFVLQEDMTIGERITSIFDEFSGPGRAVIVVNDDSPTIPARSFELAFDALASEEVDIVLGPIRDGHLYLIGMSGSHPDLLRGMVWTGPSALQKDIDHIAKSGLGWYLLPEWYDVDTPQGLKQLKDDLLADGDNTSACNTQCYVRELAASGRI